jgi:argininosuccinate synthase
MTRIVLAYPDAVWGREPHRFLPDPVRVDEAIAWLVERHDAEPIALLLDFGQGRELEALRDRALAAGAARAHVLDVADPFVARFVLPTLKAGALHLDGRPSAPGLARMAFAQKLVEIAAIEQTSVVAHAYGDADHSIATAVHELAAGTTVLAVPQALLASTGDAVDTAPGPALPRPSEPAFVDLSFGRGVPTAINGIAMPLLDLIGSLDMLTRAPGDRARHRGTAGVVLHDAHRGLQEAVGGGAVDRQALARRYVELIDAGAWFSSERRALEAQVDKLEKSVNGTVRLELGTDACRIVEIKPGRAGKALTK